MISIVGLWLPIVLAAVLVFIASSVIHMFLGYHKNDYARLPDEERVLDALRQPAVPPGDYVAPHAADMEAMKDPAYIERTKRGPVAFFTVLGAMPNMASTMVQWFVFCLAVSVFAAYVAGRALAPGAEYGDVFRFTGTTAFIAYAAALWPMSIWYKRKWSTTLKSTFDGLVYGLLTAGVFGWLWP